MDMTDTTPRPPATAWWENAIGYEIYIRSFADSNGDGIGDLAGIESKLDHLAWLGVDVVWITPFYPSPMADFGYDVADYVGVEPQFGTLADFDAVVEKAHALGMKVVIDIVPNHSSDHHEWFVDALTGKDARHRDKYMWADPAADGGPPNNWVSHFGGPAWTFDEASGQYYLHLFLPEQPDLNWRNPEVLDAFDEILRFWMERGVDGFRIDVAHALIKDENLTDNPLAKPLEENMHPMELFYAYDHKHDLTQPEALDVYKRWRAVVKPYDAMLLGETYTLDPQQLAKYLRDDDGLHAGFWFKPMRMEWSAPDIRDILMAPTQHTDRGLAWVLSSHDDPRPVTRFGGGAVGERRAFALTTFMFGLPGMNFLYQGEELALPNGVVDPADAADPVQTRNEGAIGRDVVRTPVPWDESAHRGFTTGERPWLPIGHDDPAHSMAAQKADPDAPIHGYRALIAFQKLVVAEAGTAPIEWLEAHDTVVGFRRGPLTFLLNVGNEPSGLPPQCSDGEVVFASTLAEAGTIPANGALVIRA